MILKVHDLSRGGAGVARDESGRVVFIPFSAPGDVVRVHLTDSDKRFAKAEILEILEPSPLRQVPPCPVFGRCGGCQWQHLPYELQWKTKLKGVAEALKRAGLDLPKKLEEFPAERIWEYRNRVQLKGLGRELGYFESGSHRLIGANRCDIARPEINQVWEETREEGAKLNRPYKVEVEVLPDGKVRKVWNSRHGAAGFRQVHDEQNEKMVRWVVDRIAAGAGKDATVLDLFGGSGNFSRGLAGQVGQVHCVDLSSPETRPAGFPENVFFHRAPVVKWLRNLGGIKTGSLAAVIDPPRQGLGAELSEIAEALEKSGVTETIAIGCDPDAWARDLVQWNRRGWVLQEVMVIDLFPQTSHVESVGRLVRAI